MRKTQSTVNEEELLAATRRSSKKKVEAPKETEPTPIEEEEPPKRRKEISFVNEKFMSERGSEAVKVMPGVTLTNMGQMGEMYSSRSGGIFQPLNGQRMSRAAFMD